MHAVRHKPAVESGPESPIEITKPEVQPLEIAVAEVEKATILAALEECNNHRERTAHLLGISVRTLHYKMNRYSLQ